MLRRERELEATVIKPADAERQAAIMRAEGQRQAIVTLAEADAKKAEFDGTGQGEQIRLVGQAEADVTKAKAEARREELVAEADGEKARLLAIAEGQRASLLAEAEGKERLAEALNNYDGAAIQLTLGQLFVEKLPEMVEGASRPLSNIDKFTVIDTGGNGSGPLGKLSSVVPANLLGFVQSFEAVTGIDLKAAFDNRGRPSTNGHTPDTEEPPAAPPTAPTV